MLHLRFPSDPSKDFTKSPFVQKSCEPFTGPQMAAVPHCKCPADWTQPCWQQGIIRFFLAVTGIIPHPPENAQWPPSVIPSKGMLVANFTHQGLLGLELEAEWRRLPGKKIEPAAGSSTLEGHGRKGPTSQEIWPLNLLDSLRRREDREHSSSFWQMDGAFLPPGHLVAPGPPAEPKEF